MGNKIVNKGRIDELTDFVEDGGDVFRPGPFLQALELVFPEREKLGVGQPGVDLVSKIALGEHFDHIGQGSARNLGESQDGVEQTFGRVTVRIDECYSPTLFEVVDGHVFQQGRFAGAGFSQDVDMTQTVGKFDTESSRLVSVYSGSKEVGIGVNGIFFEDGETIGSFDQGTGNGPGDVGEFGINPGQVPERGQFHDI